MARKPYSPPGEPPARGGRPSAVIVAAVAVWLTVAVLALPHLGALRWAARELPGYLDGTFDDPPERLLLLEALARMDDDPDSPDVERLLRRSAAIDPNGEASYWLAHRAAEQGREAEALAGLERWLTIDPGDARAAIELARLHRRAGRAAQARAVLERARDHLAREVELSRPRLIPEVGVRFNRKAREAHEAFVQALAEIEAELARP